MDSRQLAAFCAVVERASFSQAAEQLGVTQPAVSLQIRSLEKRLGVQLLDRSGRRVEPTDARRRLYPSAPRLLAPEGQLHVALTVSDTRRIVEQVARRELELGVVGAARRYRGVVFEPFFRDEVVLAVPREHRFAGKTVSVDQLQGEPLIVMQEGAGVRQVIEDELRAIGMRLRDLDVRIELGLQESVRSAVAAGHGVTFISRSAVEADLAAGTLAAARVHGLDPVREIFLARASGRSETRVAHAFVEFARERRPS